MLLCMMLALVFAGSAFSGLMNSLQHAPGLSLDHEDQHSAFSGIAAAHDSLHDHDAPGLEDSTPPDHRSEGHHHHQSDSGSGLLGSSSFHLKARLAESRPHPVGIRPLGLGVRASGPERPPRSFPIHA